MRRAVLYGKLYRFVALRHASLVVTHWRVRRWKKERTEKACWKKASVLWLPIQVLNRSYRGIASFQVRVDEKWLGELLLEPLIHHFSDGPSLLASAAHVLSAGHDPGHLRLARG